MAKLTAKQLRHKKAEHAKKMIRLGYIDFDGFWHVCTDTVGRAALADELMARGLGGLAFEVEIGHVRRALDMKPDLHKRVAAHYTRVCAVV